MAPYWQIDLEYIYMTFGVGFVLTILIVLARCSHVMSFTLDKRTDRQIEDSVHEFGGGVKETNRPMPLMIWAIAIGYFLWAVGYVWYIGQVGY